MFEADMSPPVASPGRCTGEGSCQNQYNQHPPGSRKAKTAAKAPLGVY